MRPLLILWMSLAFLSAAHAQRAPEWDDCGKQGVDPDTRLRSCTAIIQSGRLSAAELAAPYNNRGNAYKDKGDLDRAIADYDQAIRLDPKDSYPYTNRGNAYSRKGDLDRAFADHTQAIDLGTKNGLSYNNRCWLRATAGRDLPLALADCDNAIRLAPDSAGFLDSRGLVYLRLGRLDEAIADYGAALKKDPKIAASLYGRGIAKQRKGDRAGGDGDIAAAKAISPNIAERFDKYGVR